MDCFTIIAIELDVRSRNFATIQDFSKAAIDRPWRIDFQLDAWFMAFKPVRAGWNLIEG